MEPVLGMLWGGPWDIGIVAVVVVLLFGGSKIAGFGKNLGEGMKEFKKAVHEGDESVASPAVAVAAGPAPAEEETAKAKEQ